MLSRPYEGRVVHIGDSYHATSPQLGQGANMALLDAMALAQSVGAEGAAEVGPHYAQLRQGHVRLFQTLSNLFTPVYQSDSHALPLLRDRIVGPISRMRPARYMLGSLVTGLMGRPLARLGLKPYQD
jgi:2-polyprenyl-6-methoxyphenol hydroxylase-like FAD-dependent oxidoreductase